MKYAHQIRQQTAHRSGYSKSSATGFRLLIHKELRYEFSGGMDRTTNIPALCSCVGSVSLLVLGPLKNSFIILTNLLFVNQLSAGTGQE
jgi:hypothetical protein